MDLGIYELYSLVQGIRNRGPPTACDPPTCSVRPIYIFKMQCVSLHDDKYDPDIRKHVSLTPSAFGNNYRCEQLLA